MKITFCVPFYRGLPYLKETLLSLQAQTKAEWHCLIVDDASPETGARDIVDVLRDSRFSYVRNPQNLGLAANWNRCLELAETELVTLLHADDKLAPNYVEEMEKASALYPQATAYFCRARIIDQDGNPVFSFADRFKNLLMPSLDAVIVLRDESGLAALMKGNFVFCPTLCYRKSKLEAAPFHCQWRMVLDLDWMTRTLLGGGELVGLPTISYEYRRHAGAQTTILTQSRLRFFEEIEIHRNIAQRCLNQGWIRAAKAADQMLSVRLHLLFQIALSCLQLRGKDTFAYSSVILSTFRKGEL